jgi:hypothetical protein
MPSMAARYGRKYLARIDAAYLELAREDQVFGDDLRQADAVALLLHLLVEGGVVDLHVVDLDVPEDVVVPFREVERDGGEVAEHVMAHAEEQRLRQVIALVALRVADAVGGLAEQEIGGQARLPALVFVRTGRSLDVDGRRGHHVDEVVGLHGDVFADALAHQHRRTGDGDAAALVPEVEHVGAIFRQNGGVCHRRKERCGQRQTGYDESG